MAKRPNAQDWPWVGDELQWWLWEIKPIEFQDKPLSAEELLRMLDT